MDVSTNYEQPLASIVASPRRKRDKWAGLIAASRILYGLLLVFAGIAAFNLIGKNLSAGLLRFITGWHFDLHSAWIRWLLHKVSSVSAVQLTLVGVATFFYAGLSLVEGVGLAMEKRWAQWLIIYDTASYIPIEVYQLCKEFGWINLILLGSYIAVVIYLVWQIKKKRRGPEFKT